MPLVSLKPCNYPGCAALVRGERYCPYHERATARAYETARGTSAARGYGGRWRKLRSMVLASNPLCADPYGIHKAIGVIVLATDVDHIQARSDGGDDSMENLQPLCHSCHSRKTAVQDGGWGKGG